MDIWGPTQITSLSGLNYYVSPIDYVIREKWIYSIGKNLYIFDAFHKSKVLVQNETSIKINCLKSDNGDEYCTNDFDNYYSINIIRRIKVTPRK